MESSFFLSSLAYSKPVFPLDTVDNPCPTPEAIYVESSSDEEKEKDEGEEEEDYGDPIIRSSVVDDRSSSDKSFPYTSEARSPTSSAKPSLEREIVGENGKSIGLNKNKNNPKNGFSDNEIITGTIPTNYRQVGFKESIPLHTEKVTQPSSENNSPLVAVGSLNWGGGIACINKMPVSVNGGVPKVRSPVVKQPDLKRRRTGDVAPHRILDSYYKLFDQVDLVSYLKCKDLEDANRVLDLLLRVVDPKNIIPRPRNEYLNESTQLASLRKSRQNRKLKLFLEDIKGLDGYRFTKGLLSIAKHFYKISTYLVSDDVLIIICISTYLASIGIKVTDFIDPEIIKMVNTDFRIPCAEFHGNNWLKNHCRKFACLFLYGKLALKPMIQLSEIDFKELASLTSEHEYSDEFLYLQAYNAMRRRTRDRMDLTPL